MKNKGKDKHSEESGEDIILEADESIQAEENCANKLKKLRTELAEAKAKQQEYLTGWQKARADYANFKTREENSMGERRERIVSEIIYDFFHILDSFDMAMGNTEVWESVDENWRKGIESIRAQFINTMEKYGVQEIIETGIKFNPHIHEPLEIVETKDAGEDDLVLAVVIKGYKMGDNILRPAKVRIGKYKN